MTLRLRYRLLFSFFAGIFLLLMDTGILLAQDGAEGIAKSYREYRRYGLQEKIFVHTDRSFYLCGQIMWCKAYLVDAADNRPLSLSKVAYVELLNRARQPMWQGKIAMKKGLGSGSFFIPFTVPSGNYELRAYTRWMKNGSPEAYFKKMITVVNTTRVLDSAVVQDTTYYSAAFFPEGGNLVSGLTSEIAFRVWDNHQKAQDGNGVVVDEQGDTLTHFQTFRQGMGRFSLKPEKDKKYMALITLKNGMKIRQPLPEAYPEGMVMHLEDNGGATVKVSVESSTPAPGGSAPWVYLIARNHQQVRAAMAEQIRSGRAVFQISRDSLGPGLSELTVFNELRQPVCERLFFEQPGERLDINAKTEKESYSTRERVVIPVLTTAAGGPASADLSVSVYRLNGLSQAGPENIYEYLWLFSELNGTAGRPGEYFGKSSETVTEELNDLLMTSGWRKFDWQKAVQGEKPFFEYAPEYNGHIITGRVVNNLTGQPVGGVMIYLGVAGTRVQLAGCVSDSLGRIHFEMKDYYGAHQLVVQPNWERDSIYRIEIQSPFSEKFDRDPLPPLHLSAQSADELSDLHLDMQVLNAYSGSRMQQFAPTGADTLPFYGHPYKTYLLDNYTRFTTMEEVMREYVAEVATRKRKGRYHFMTFNAPGFDLQKVQVTETMFRDDPLVLLDGIPVFDIDKIIAYDPLRVKKLEVVAQQYYFGPISAQGILSYTTYKGDLEGFRLDPRALVMDDEGLERQRIFYSPQYATQPEKASRLPDFRELLFWDPDVRTNEKGEATVSFYTGDLPGRYQVVVQGITGNGEAGNALFSFPVSPSK